MRLRIDGGATIYTALILGALALSTIGAYRDGQCTDKGVSGCIGIGSARLLGYLDVVQGIAPQIGETKQQVRESVGTIEDALDGTFGDLKREIQQ